MRCAGFTLVCVAGLKVASAFSGVRYLAHPDPVLGFLTNRSVLLGAGAVELAVGLGSLRWPNSRLVQQSLLALCLSFVIYRWGLLLSRTPALCPCLGRASDWLRLRPADVDHVARWLLVALLGISLTSMWLARDHRPAPPL